MYELYLMVKSRMLQSWNELIFKDVASKSGSKKPIMYLITLGIILLVAYCIIFGILVVGLELIHTVSLEYSNAQQLNSLFALIVALFLGWTLKDIFPSLIRILEARDAQTLLITRLSPLTYILGKLLERYIYKVIFSLIMLISFIINILLKWNFSVQDSVLITLFIFILFAFAQVVRIWWLLTLVKVKIKRKKMIPYSFIAFCLHIFEWLSLFILIYPVIKTLHFSFSWLDSIYHLELFNRITAIYTSGGNIVHQNLLLVILILSFLIFTFSFIISKHKRNNELMNISELILDFQQPKTVYKANGKNLLDVYQKLKWLPSPTNWIIAKDLIRLTRSKKMETLYLLVFMFIGLIVSLLGFYLVDIQTGVGFSGVYITTSFGTFGSMSVIFGLVNIMGIDYEGKHIDILRSVPNISKHLIAGKFLVYYFVASPLSLISFIIPFIIYPLPIVQLLVLWIFTTPVFIIMAILSSILFPNFHYETIFDLPSTKSKMAYLFLCCLFIMVIGSIWVYTPKFISLVLLSIICIGSTTLLFLLSAKKLEEDELSRNMSLESIIK